MEINDEWEKMKYRHKRVTFQKFGSEGIEGDSCREKLSQEKAFYIFLFLRWKSRDVEPLRVVPDETGDIYMTKVFRELFLVKI